jgi:tetratricopeptide (TPR) repeat protein
MPNARYTGPQDRTLAATTLQAKFNQGVALHQQGKLAEAAQIYQEILGKQPNHFDALHLLGVIALQTQQTERGIELITKAIKQNTKVASTHSNLANALMEVKRPAEALASYDKAISLNPDFAEAYNNRGNALFVLKRPEDALASYDNAIALKPDYAEAYNNRGIALGSAKGAEEALASYDKAIALNPDYAEAHYNRGIAFGDLQRPKDALSSYDKAISLRPDYTDAYYNRGNAQADLERPEEALASYDKAIALRPDYAEVYNSRGNTLVVLRRLKDALANYDKTIALKPDYAEAYWNQSLCLLLMGHFEQGWRQYEWRKRRNKPIAARSYTQPLWLGEENIAGKTLFIYSEQGLGDTIQFCRYAKLVADLGAQVILEGQKPLMSVLADLSGVARLAEPESALPPFDYQCPLLSLPLAFKTTLSNIPNTIPYLKSSADKSRLWKEKLGETNKPRVGLVWSGGFRQNQPELWSVNSRRNIPLARLAALKHPDVEFYSLQKGEPAESELAELMRHNWDGPHIIDVTRELNDFSDTAALIDNLDLVISVDTSTAHLAGALGKPVWILNRFDTCWRWLLDRTDSPWYPTAKLYRQERAGHWDDVVQQIKLDLMCFQPSRAGR